MSMLVLVALPPKKSNYRHCNNIFTLVSNKNWIAVRLGASATTPKVTTTYVQRRTTKPHLAVLKRLQNKIKPQLGEAGETRQTWTVPSPICLTLRVR